MGATFTAERAVSRGMTSFVVVDESFKMHAEACAYLASLRALDRSINTERIYAGRLANFLNHCDDSGLDWRRITIDDLRRYMNRLVEHPISRELISGEITYTFRSNKTANAILGTACEFLRYGAARDWVRADLVADMSRLRILHWPVHGHGYGEELQFSTIRARTLKLKEIEMAPPVFSDDQLMSVVSAVSTPRDRFLILVLAFTGIRIGEALGLRREDMHLLQNNGQLDCSQSGPHLHVRRRDNANGALAKSRRHRTIPVDERLIDAYADYQYERANRLGEVDDSDFVLVNMFRPPLGAPACYHNVKKMFERTASRVGFPVRPHMFRHTAATRWLENGTPRDVVRALLGHASDRSMDVYSHATDGAKRAAVEGAFASMKGDV